MNALRSEFESICKVYFPRWRAWRSWKCRVKPKSIPGNGHCLPWRKTIYVRPDYENLRMLLIHEVCHAVTPLGHGSRWQKRMRSAADRAMAVGDAALAGALTEELAAYSNSVESARGLAFPEAYVSIMDFVNESAKSPSFASTIRAVAYHLGYPREQFVSRYRRARGVWAKAVQDRTRYQRSLRVTPPASGQKG